MTKQIKTHKFIFPLPIPKLMSEEHTETTVGTTKDTKSVVGKESVLNIGERSTDSQGLKPEEPQTETTYEQIQEEFEKDSIFDEGVDDVKDIPEKEVEDYGI